MKIESNLYLKKTKMTDVKEFLEKAQLSTMKMVVVIYAFEGKEETGDRPSVFFGLAHESILSDVYEKDPIKEKLYDLKFGMATRTNTNEIVEYNSTNIIPILVDRLRYFDGRPILKNMTGINESIEKLLVLAAKKEKHFVDNRTPTPEFDKKNHIYETIYAFVVYGEPGTLLEELFDKEKEEVIGDVEQVKFQINTEILTPGPDGKAVRSNLDDWLVDNPMPK